jgi:uncharacterized protein with PIN domain
MDWGAVLPALLGTLVGGGITVVGQTLTDKRQDSAAKGAEDRAAHRAQIERERKHVRDLHDRISEDIAWVRSAVTKWDDAANLERANGLGPIQTEIVARHDRAASLIAVVSDSDVRTAADNVYTTWGEWVNGEAGSMVNEHENSMDPQKAIKVREAFATAVRTYLEELNDREVKSYT